MPMEIKVIIAGRRYGAVPSPIDQQAKRFILQKVSDILYTSEIGRPIGETRRPAKISPLYLKTRAPALVAND